MKKTKLFLFLTQAILFFSIISCNNPLSFNTQSRKTDFPSAATGTVSGKLTFKGAIPQELIGKNTNSTNTKTAFPTVDETTCTYEITTYDSINNVPYEDIIATFNNNHTEYTLKGIPLDSPCTVEVSVFADSGKTKKILTGKNTFTLTQESPIVSADVILEPIQTTSIPNTITRSVNLAIQVENGSGVGYVQVEPSGFVCTSNDNLNYILKLDEGLSLEKSEPKTVNVSFWSGTDTENKGILLYKFSETINIFDNLETNTWVKNSSGTNADPHLKLRDGETFIADCIITEDMVRNFQSKTLYVDTTASSSTETGTSDKPFKTLQKAVNHIKFYGNETDSYTIYIKKGITISEQILWIKSNDDVRNITIAGYDGVKTITQENNSNTSLFDFSKAGCNITLRDLILDGNDTQTTLSNGGAIKNAANLTLENVTIQNFISLRESSTGGTGGTGGAIYNTNSGYLILKNSKIDSCKCESAGMAHGGAIFNTGTLELDDAVIVGCKTQAGAANNESYGGAIYNNGTCKINKAIITGCSAINSSSPSYAKGGAIYNKGSLILGDSICNSDGSPDVTIGIGTYNGEEYLNPNEAFAGAGVYSGDTSIAAIFTMNKDCVIGKYNPDSAPTKDNCGNRSCSTSLLGNGGAGVWISTYNKTMTINGGFISYNYAENTADNPGESIPITGVGLCFYGNETNPPEIKNLVISYNKAYIKYNLDGSVQGIGFYFYRSVTLNNVKIENNTYETPSTTQVNGKGLYSNKTSTVTLKGTTCFGTSDDIYLGFSSPDSIGKIKVDSTLNPQNTFGVPQQYVATITSGSYTDSLQVINGTKVDTEYKKFSVTPAGGNFWHIGSDGKLSDKVGTKSKLEPLNVGDIVFYDGSSTPYSEIASRESGCTNEEKESAIAVIFRVNDGSDGNKTLGVGIKHEKNKQIWCKEGIASYGDIKFDDTICNADNSNAGDGNYTFVNSPNKDGSKNLKKMVDKGATYINNSLQFNDDGTIDFDESSEYYLKTYYPAFWFAYYYGNDPGHNIKYGSDYITGWYLPSVSELNDIYLANKENKIIENALTLIGGDTFGTGEYWSSSSYDRYGSNEYASAYSFYSNCPDETRKKNPFYVCAVRAFD